MIDIEIILIDKSSVKNLAMSSARLFQTNSQEYYSFINGAIHVKLYLLRYYL